MSVIEGWKMDGCFNKIIHGKNKSSLDLKSREIIFTSKYFHDYGHTTVNEFVEYMKYNHATPLDQEDTKSYEKVYNTLKRKTTIKNKVNQIATELGWR